MPDKNHIETNTLNQPLTLARIIKYLNTKKATKNNDNATKLIPNLRNSLNGLSEKAMIVSQASLILFLIEKNLR